MRVRTPQVAPLFLRVLLGVTFQYAGLQKLLSRGFFDPRGPASIDAQMAAAAQSSLIRVLVAPLVPHANLVGHAIAYGEIIVGMAALFGLFTHLAAIGGAVLSVSFWLTVNDHIHPYFFVPDIPWGALWVLLWMLGPGEFLALDWYLGILRPPAPPPPPWLNRTAAPSGQLAPWPGQPAQWNNQSPGGLSRRQITTFGLTAAGLLATVLVGLRLLHRGPFAGGGYPIPTPELGGGQGGQTSAAPAPSPTSGRPTRPAGQPIGSAGQLPVGGALKFTHRGEPAVALQPKAGSYIGLSLVCTHAGCISNLPSGGRIVCGCHGSVFSAANGTVLQGPATSPLERITIIASGGNLYAS